MNEIDCVSFTTAGATLTNSSAVAMVADRTCLHQKASKSERSFSLTYRTCVSKRKRTQNKFENNTKTIHIVSIWMQLAF